MLALCTMLLPLCVYVYILSEQVYLWLCTYIHSNKLLPRLLISTTSGTKDRPSLNLYFQWCHGAKQNRRLTSPIHSFTNPSSYVLVFKLIISMNFERFYSFAQRLFFNFKSNVDLHDRFDFIITQNQKTRHFSSESLQLIIDSSLSWESLAIEHFNEFLATKRMRFVYQTGYLL